MKKLMFVAVAALSTVAFARSGHEDVSADVEGIYDITLTTKSLQHATKTKTETFTKGGGATAWQKFQKRMEFVENLAGLTTNQIKIGKLVINPADPQLMTADKITIKYTYFDYVLVDKNSSDVPDNRSYKTKVVSASNKGVYDSDSGKVYIWDTVKRTIPAESVNLERAKAKIRSDVATGYVAYEAPLGMHGQLVKTNDGKAAGGFRGGNAKAADGTRLDFSGLTAFGTGTLNKEEVVKTVAGNVAAKESDPKFGCYGTWKLNKCAQSYQKLDDALVSKGCVELVNEVSDK